MAAPNPLTLGFMGKDSVISVNIAADRNYQLQAATTLSPADWTSVSPVTAGNAFIAWSLVPETDIALNLMCAGFVAAVVEADMGCCAFQQIGGENWRFYIAESRIFLCQATKGF